MANFALMIALWATVIVSYMFDAASNQSVDDSGNSSFSSTNEGRLNNILDARSVGIRSIGPVGTEAPLPTVSSDWISTLFKIFTWDVSYIKGYAEPLRIIFAGAQWWFTIQVITEVAPAIAAVLSVFIEIGQGIAGAVGGVFRSLRFFG